MAWEDLGATVRLIDRTVQGRLFTAGTASIVLAELEGPSLSPLQDGAVRLDDREGPPEIDFNPPAYDVRDVPPLGARASTGGPLDWVIRMYFTRTSATVDKSVHTTVDPEPWSVAFPDGVNGSSTTYDHSWPEHFVYFVDSAVNAPTFEIGRPPGKRANVTSVPTFLQSAQMPASVITAIGLGTTGIGQTWHVQYSHPMVIQTPAGDWLMLMARTLKLAGSEGDSTETPSDLEQVFKGADPVSNTLRDIVALRSSSADFQEFEGPITVVSGLDAVPDQRGVLRLWVGVPTAVSDAESLLIAYSVTVGLNPFELDTVSDIPTLLDETFGVSAPYLARGRGVLAAKTLKWSEINAAFAAFSGETAKLDDTVEGNLDGVINVWMATGGRPQKVTLRSKPIWEVLDERWETGTGIAIGPNTDLDSLPKIVDPALLRCADGTLTMYFAVRFGKSSDGLRDGTYGTGIWRSARVPSLLVRTDGTKHLDFVVAETPSYSPGAEIKVGGDYLLATDITSNDGPDAGDYADPDAVQVPDGEAFVFIAGRVRGTGQNRVAGVVITLEGRKEDACAPYTEAW